MGNEKKTFCRRTGVCIFIVLCFIYVITYGYMKDMYTTDKGGIYHLFFPLPLKDTKSNVTGVYGEHIDDSFNAFNVRNYGDDNTKDSSVINPTDNEKNNGTLKTLFNSTLVYPEAFRIHNKLYGHHGNETCEKRFPSCILLGVYKCGTRELMDFISVHPNILIKNDPYEFPFFSGKLYGTSNSSLENFRHRMPCIFKDQISFTKFAGYFTDSKTIERIYKFDKNMKMILMVREPVQRFISHVWFTHPTLTFDRINKLLADSLQRTSARWSRLPTQISKKKTPLDGSMMNLLRYSEYDIPYERFTKYFSKDQILVIESEEFKRDPYPVIHKIETYLELPHKIPKDTYVYNIEKKYHCLKSLNGGQICYDNARGRDYKQEINNVTMQKLREYFHPHNERFFAKLGKRFDWNY
ncbi:Sulfotransferase [Mactra antiquata]